MLINHLYVILEKCLFKYFATPLFFGSEFFLLYLFVYFSGIQFITPAGPRQSLLLAKDPEFFKIIQVL